MSMSTDPERLVRAFLDNVEPNAVLLTDPFDNDCTSVGVSGNRALPIRLRGLLAQLLERERVITQVFVQQRGAALQDFISRGLDKSTAYDAKVRELNRKEEADRSSLREDWYTGLSEDKAVFDDYCLAIAKSAIQTSLPKCLHGPFARLSLEYANIVRRADSQRKASEQSIAGRGQLNTSVVKSILQGLSNDKEEAKSRLIGRWFRELTPEQAAAFDKAHTAQPGSGINQAMAMESAASGNVFHRDENEEREEIRANKEAVENPVESLSQLQYDLLQALRTLNATDDEKRATGPRIAQKVGGNATSQSVKAPLANLRLKQLVDSKAGRGGGSWLTPKGLVLINDLRPTK